MRPDIARYEKNLREELDGSALYAALAAAEVDPVRKDLFLQLSHGMASRVAFVSTGATVVASCVNLKRDLETQLKPQRVGNRRVGAGVDDVLQIGLHGKPLRQLHQIGDLDRPFGACHRESLQALRAHVV